jgi:hypothetical protein
MKTVRTYQQLIQLLEAGADTKAVLEKLAEELDYMAWQAEATSTIGRKRKEVREHWLGISEGTKLCAETVRGLAASL